MALTDYQLLTLKSIKEYDFIKNISRMTGKCHDALIGEWVNWWLGQKKVDCRICNPARGSKIGSNRCTADLLFLERFYDESYFEVKGVAEVENNEKKILEKIKSLSSYEKHKKGERTAYPDLMFTVLCYTINIPNDEIIEKIYNNVVHISKNSNLLWIVCEIGKSLEEEARHNIHIPNFVRGSDLFFYYRNFASINFYFIRNGKKIGDIFTPGVTT